VRDQFAHDRSREWGGGCSNCTGDKIDKFEEFDLTPLPASEVGAPLIQECYANFECCLYDGRQIAKHGLFIWEVVKAHVAVSPKLPETVHYRGEGKFMVSGRAIDLRKKFKLQNLWRTKPLDPFAAAATISAPRAFWKWRPTGAAPARTIFIGSNAGRYITAAIWFASAGCRPLRR
jgi:hypothetical protein